LIAIPVAVIGSISLAAKRAIIVRDPAVLETVSTCRTIIFDKTGTLTYGQPQLTEQLLAENSNGDRADATEILSLVASLEQYSKHPLAEAIVRAGRDQGAALHEVAQISEPPGQGLRGTVAGHEVRLTSRKQLTKDNPAAAAALPPQAGGLECVILVDGRSNWLNRCVKNLIHLSGVPDI
jgi:cation transport ATPase